MLNPLVTIYITNYNYQNFLKESIESVLSQTYKNYELIIIDDGSEDKSIDIINKYRRISNIQIVRQKRRGLNRSNNVAIKKSKGKYLIRLDADDYFKKNAIEEMVTVLESDLDCSLVFPDYHLVDSNGSIIRTIQRHNFNNNVELFDQPAHGACTMFRLDVLKMIGGYDEHFDRQDGYDIWLKIIGNYKVKNINKPLFFYRQHGNNLTKNNSILLKTRAKIKEKYIKINKIEIPRVLTIIPSRGTSKEIFPNPLKIFGNKTLIDWTLESIVLSNFSENVMLTTPDQKLIDYVASKFPKIISIKRKNELARLNLGLEETINESIQFFSKNFFLPDAILILYLEYPFKKYWQINEAVHTMKIFNVNMVDGIQIDDRFYYKHDGKGLKPIQENVMLRLERDELYRRVGGIHLMETKFFLKNKKMIAGKIGHIHFDELSSFQIKTKMDWEIGKFLTKKC